MKSELINLLDRLKAIAPESPDPLPRGVHGGFQSLTIFPNGSAHAQYRWGINQFANLDELEALAYPDSATTTRSPEQNPGREVHAP